MCKDAYTNTVTLQVQDLEQLCTVQADKCFDLAVLDGLLGREKAAKIKRVLIVGCGDSYSAAGAMVPGFRKLSGVGLCNSPDPMDFCRYYTERKVLAGFTPEEVLLVTVSFSGSAQRAEEAIRKAQSLGVAALLITRTPDSLCGRAADYVFDVRTPDGCNTPGLRSYYASLMGLAALGAYLGLSRGALTEADFLETGASIASYTKEFMKEFERIDELMFQQAVRMKDLTKFEVIADWNEGYSAQFVEQKFIECSGVFCDHTTSEEFAHISFFHRVPSDFGTIVMINEADPSLSRMKDTIGGLLAQHRPTVIVTDADPAVFDDRSDGDVGKVHKLYDLVFENDGDAQESDRPVICSIPKAPCQWMSPFVDFLPGSLLAGYHAALCGRNFFGGTYDFRTQTWNR